MAWVPSEETALLYCNPLLDCGWPCSHADRGMVLYSRGIHVTIANFMTNGIPKIQLNYFYNVVFEVKNSNQRLIAVSRSVDKMALDGCVLGAVRGLASHLGHACTYACVHAPPHRPWGPAQLGDVVFTFISALATSLTSFFVQDSRVQVVARASSQSSFRVCGADDRGKEIYGVGPSKKEGRGPGEPPLPSSWFPSRLFPATSKSEPDVSLSEVCGRMDGRGGNSARRGGTPDQPCSQEGGCGKGAPSAHWDQLRVPPSTKLLGSGELSGSSQAWWPPWRPEVSLHCPRFLKMDVMWLLGAESESSISPRDCQSSDCSMCLSLQKRSSREAREQAGAAWLLGARGFPL